MSKNHLSRRQFVAGMTGLAGAIGIKGMDLGQSPMDEDEKIKIEDGRVAAPMRRRFSAAKVSLRRSSDGWHLTNGVTGEVMRLSASAPLFDFGDYQIGGKSSGSADWKKRERGDEIRWVGEWHFSSPQSATVRSILVHHRNTELIYKRAEIVLEGSKSLLHSVTVDEAVAPDDTLLHNPGLQSHPIIGRSFFCGIEYPIAATTAITGNQITLSHAPGCWIEPGRTYRSRTAVYGAAPAGNARAVFESYIEALRPNPIGIHFNYNSWWTSPVPYNEADILQIIKQFRDNLYQPYHVMTKSFCIDMGWSKNTTIWQIDPSLFPHGFSGLEKALGEMESAVGLWISPSAVYGQALNLAWAQKAGYEADAHKCCLGGPKYQAAFKHAISSIVANFGLRHVKFDGYVEVCNDTNHGHQPGIMSAEPIAEGIIDVYQNLRLIKPDIWLEPTCYGFDPSPWWVMYCNSVIGCFGDDSPNGQAPCPIYRETYTTARDYYNLKGDAHIQIPIAAIDDLGIDHQNEEPFQNDAVMTVLRGNQFLPLYLNPVFMSPRRWEFLAALMKWTTRNADLLGVTHPIYPASWRKSGAVPWVYDQTEFPREVYGYAHWSGDRGLLCLRNPWIEPATFTLVPARDIGVPADHGILALSLIYPERAEAASGIRPEESVELSIAPYETALYEIGSSSHKTRAAPTEWHRPELHISVVASRLEVTAEGPAFGADYTRLLPKSGAYLKVAIEGEMGLPGPGDYQLMMLIENTASVSYPVADFQLNGESVAPAFINSETGWRATGNQAADHWLWLIVPIKAQTVDLKGSIVPVDATNRISGWIVQREAIEWKRLSRVDGTQLPSPELQYLGAVRVCEGIKMNDQLPVEHAEAPVERINGFYLDTLNPSFVSQQWGTLQRNVSVTGAPLTIGGRVFARGLGTHANSKIIFDLDGEYRRFKAWAGADQATTPSITMEVKVDGKTVWKSGLLTRSSAAQRVEVDIAGAKHLELLVGDGGNGIDGDHADWADAMLMK